MTLILQYYTILTYKYYIYLYCQYTTLILYEMYSIHLSYTMRCILQGLYYMYITMRPILHILYIL